MFVYTIGVENFGEFLRRYMRAELHWDIRTFAKACDISTQTLSVAFKASDEMDLNPKTYRRIASGMGLGVEELDVLWKGTPRERWRMAGKDVARGEGTVYSDLLARELKEVLAQAGKPAEPVSSGKNSEKQLGTLR